MLRREYLRCKALEKILKRYEDDTTKKKTHQRTTEVSGDAND